MVYSSRRSSWTPQIKPHKNTHYLYPNKSFCDLSSWYSCQYAIHKVLCASDENWWLRVDSGKMPPIWAGQAIWTALNPFVHRQPAPIPWKGGFWNLLKLLRRFDPPCSWKKYGISLSRKRKYSPHSCCWPQQPWTGSHATFYCSKHCPFPLVSPCIQFFPIF